MNLLTHYEAAIARGEIQDDINQRDVLMHMQRLTDDLKAPQSWFWWKNKVIKGLYLYGSVGVGKTYLVDLLYQQVDEPKKARFHFHHFMQQIDLKLRQNQGQKDPLRQIAKDLAKSTRLLCFDEFLVHDVAHAMILAQLLDALIGAGVILVISSNTHPDDLYLKGVHRERFLPAIALIKKNCEIVRLVEYKDYRCGRIPLSETYLHPLNAQTQQTMQHEFALLAGNSEINGALKVQNREIPYLQCGLKAVWFDFSVLCNLPRSQLDYLELGERFEIVFLSNIPRLTENHTAQVILFVYLIDVLYDIGIKLVISAEVGVDALYVAGEMKETFKRTLSRLKEMQSADYLNRHPRRSNSKGF